MTLNRFPNPSLTARRQPTLDRESRWFQEHRQLLEAWAWQGFQSQGAGLVVVRATTSQSGPWPWSDEPSQLRPSYLTGSDAEAALGCLGDDASKTRITQALQSYDPNREAIAMVLFGQRPMVVQLMPSHRHPQEALNQLERRQQEFLLLDTNA